MIQFFLNRRVLTNLMTILIVGIGLRQFMTMKREAFPEVTFDIVTVQTVYPGASPEEVERLVTIPIEDSLKIVDNVDYVESYSIEGISMIVLRLYENLNRQEVGRVVSDVQQAAGNVEDLPEEAKAPVVQEMTSNRPLIVLSVAGGDALTRDEFAKRLKDAIEDIPDVARVDQDGDLAREIWVEVDPAKLARYRLTIGEIANTLRQENIDLSAGSIESGGQDLLIRTVGSFKTAGDVAGVILRGNDERSFVRVKDVARVRETFAEAKVLARAAGDPSINLQVRKTRDGDAIHMADEVKKVMAQNQEKAQKLGLRMMISDDISFFIKRRLRVMKSNMIQGGFLIVLALFLFLDWRLALVAAGGVPISFGLAMIGGAPFGLTINLLSLLGFIIVLGMLDDDSVAVAENIYRHLEMGKPPMKAAIEGVKEVMLPVLGSVGATSSAFIPFAIMKGIMGKFLFMIPVIVILCFIASVLEAFFILPSHVLDILPYGKPVSEKKDGRWYAELIMRYRTALAWSLDHRYKFLGIAVGFLVLTAVVAGLRLKMVMFPPGLIDQFFVQMELPEGAALSETERAVIEAERIMLSLPSEDLEGITATVGLTGYEESARRGTHYGQIRVFLVPQENRERKTDDIINELRPKLQAIPGVKKMAIEKLRPGPPVGRAVQVKIRGDDTRTLQTIADEVKMELAAMTGVTDIKDNFEGGKTELRVIVNKKEAAYAGVPTSQVARHILYAFEGGEATKIRRMDEEVIVKVKLSPEHRKNAESLDGLLVLNNRGQQINLAPLVRIERAKSPPYIEHYNFKRAIQVTADVDNVNITSYQANARVKELFKNLKERYPGYDAVYGGEEERTQESMQSLKMGFLLAIFLDIIILATLFNSYVQPLIILLTIPIGLTGVTWALIFHGQPASFMALLGAVAMTGVVVNNAIVLVDFINNRRATGLPLREAAIEAGAIRLRPIFASSITTLLGLFPTAYGIGGYEPFVAPLCLTLAWGLALAMPLTLFAIPTATVIVDDILGWLGRKKESLSKKLPSFLL
ncbi:MAG: efflux RND transporter permease subunit [Elusimicrobia bacterium]|nr:efflux RND transporter permease subunit [Elusimicrobiota bacterium]